MNIQREFYRFLEANKKTYWVEHMGKKREQQQEQEQR